MPLVALRQVLDEVTRGSMPLGHASDFAHASLPEMVRCRGRSSTTEVSGRWVTADSLAFR